MSTTDADHDPRLHAVFVAICVFMPLCAAIWFWPHEAGRYTNAEIVIWMDSVVVLSAFSLTFYRLIVTMRTTNYFEQTFLTLAILFFPWVRDGSAGFPDVAGMSLTTLLMDDRRIFESALLIATVLLFMLRDRSRRASTEGNPD